MDTGQKLCQGGLRRFSSIKHAEGINTCDRFLFGDTAMKFGLPEAKAVEQPHKGPRSRLRPQAKSLQRKGVVHHELLRSLHDNKTVI